MANRKAKKNIDQSAAVNQSYNDYAGAQKNMEVGRYLLPLNDGAGGFTTNAATAKALPSKGRNIAVYNNSSTVASVTLGDDASLAALAVGATDANGNVGIACTPNDWTFIACNERAWVRTSAATALVYLIEDDTSK